mgnify:CR=1 FL=1
MNKVLKYFQEFDSKEVFSKNIRVYGWEHEYDHLLISSISKYLFEELDITEHIVPVNEDNRPGRIAENKYVTVHDTGDASILHTAKFWTDAVYNRSWEQRPGEVVKYLCSYQYVVDNKDIFHNVPDNEVAYHAGCGTKFDYALYNTNISGTNPKPVVTISEDGYFEVDKVVTNILAPRYQVVKNGVVEIDRIATNLDINDQGILCRLIDGIYYIGETYFNQGYRKICNHGGNNNSIGIESCITEGDDIYYTWQKTAKLVAYLLDNNNLTINDVVQHHYFSGKNCPQTIRMNGMWEHFLELVKFELDIRAFIKEGYKIELIVNDDRVKLNGRVKENENIKGIEFVVRTTINGEIEELKFNK